MAQEEKVSGCLPKPVFASHLGGTGGNMVTMLIGILSIALYTMPGEAEASDSVATAINRSPSAIELTSSAENAIDEKPYHISVVLNNSVERYIEYFRTRGKRTFQRWLDNSAPYIGPMKKIFKDENLPEELVYVAMIESGFDSSAVSRSKAAGHWQFMPDTARQYGLRSNWWVDERKDYVKSTLAAAQHFKDLQSRFSSWPLVLAAYNAGAGKVQRAILKAGSGDFWDLKESAYLRRETKSYVPKFMAAILIARDPAAYGFRVPNVKPLRYDEVMIKEVTDLRIVAYCTDSTYEIIKSLNPEINGKSTPPDDSRYLLKIPKGKKNIFLARIDAIRKAAIRISWDEEVYISLLNQDDSSREIRNGLDLCPVFVKKTNLAQRLSQQTARRDSAQEAGSAFSDKDMQMSATKPVTACVRQTRPAELYRNVVPWALPPFSNTADRQR
jgi:hypothetical protein